MFVSAVATFSGCAHEPELFLRFYDPKEDAVVKEFPVHVGEKFYLDYIHSSEKTPIHDIFIIDETGRIVLVEERFDWYAVGLESNPEYREASIVFDGSTTRVLLRRVFPVLSLRVGWVADQVLTFRGEKTRLKDLAEGGELLQISVTDRTSRSRTWPWK